MLVCVVSCKECFGCGIKAQTKCPCLEWKEMQQRSTHRWADHVNPSTQQWLHSAAKLPTPIRFLIISWLVKAFTESRHAILILNYRLYSLVDPFSTIEYACRMSILWIFQLESKSRHVLRDGFQGQGQYHWTKKHRLPSTSTKPRRPNGKAASPQHLRIWHTWVFRYQSASKVKIWSKKRNHISLGYFVKKNLGVKDRSVKCKSPSLLKEIISVHRM